MVPFCSASRLEFHSRRRRNEFGTLAAEIRVVYRKHPLFTSLESTTALVSDHFDRPGSRRLPNGLGWWIRNARRRETDCLKRPGSHRPAIRWREAGGRMLTDLAKRITPRVHALAVLALVWATAVTVQAQNFHVDSATNFTGTDIFASGGEVFEITASGAVDLAVPDSYQTDPNGTILKAPAAGTGAYNFFQASAIPYNTPPAVGQRKLVAQENWLAFGPHGALVMGYYPPLEDLERDGYPTLFKVVESGDTPPPPRPEAGGPLWLGLNLASPFTPSGSYTVTLKLQNGATATTILAAGTSTSVPDSVGIAKTVSATGTLDAASDGGSYLTGSDGVITKAPGQGTPAYNFFRDSAAPIGMPPAVGETKLVLPRHPRQLAPYGALVAGWSPTANPTTYSDFPLGFEFVGTSGTITAPEGGGFLFFAVNDFFISDGTDNAGYYSVTVKAMEKSPSIEAAILLAGFGGGTTITSGGFVEIYGANFSDETRSWSADDFVDGVAPISLADVKVFMDGKPAFVYFVSPNQVDCIAPDGLAAGEIDVAVMKGESMSAAFRVPVAERAPALLAPVEFLSGEQQFVVGILQDGFYAGPEDLIPGAAFRSATAGDHVVFYGIGFGQGDPVVPVGSIPETATTLPNVEVKFGDVSATVEYAGFSPGNVGLYQLNVVVPEGVTGDVRVTVTVDGVPLAQELWIRIG